MTTQIKLLVTAFALVVSMVILFAAFDVYIVHGNEVGVKETWYSGVQNESYPPRTYFLLPWERMQRYSTAMRVFIMNDKQNEDEVNTGRNNDSYLVQSADSQDMHLSLQVQWRISPEHVVSIHRQVGSDEPGRIEETMLRPRLMRVVKDQATARKAIEAYSGAGLVELQRDIEKELSDPIGELSDKGIIIDSFVIEHIKLDPEYVSQITARQIAIQKEQRAKQEEIAANAEALKAKAVARADYEKTVVEAERDKEVKVLAAEANAEQEVLKAEAEKKKAVLAAEAKKESGELEAAAILAIGRAKAESEKLLFTAYSSPGSEIYAKIQIADSMSRAFGNIKGYLPESMQIFTLGESFNKAIENVVKGEKSE